VRDIKLIFEKQVLHVVLLAILLIVLFTVAQTEGFLTGWFLGMSTATWFYLAVACPVLHQLYVWFCWRTELHLSLITRTFGEKGFTYYSIVFMVLLILRPILITGLAISNRNSLDCNQLLFYGLAFIFTLLCAYLFYSAMKYFGLKRALGIDHFDSSYRREPLIRGGMFRFSSNAMYVFGLLLLWIPGLLCFSRAALLVALFSHIYVWVHYYCVEKPDMKRMYGGASEE
jgi:hypothetical protein